MRKLNIFLILLLSALLVISGYMIWKEVSLQQKEKNEFDKIIEIVENTEKTTDLETDTDDKTGDESKTVETVQSRNLNPLFEMNSDCVGWIYIEGTNINYPVMHTPNSPQKYLRKNFNGEYSQSGVPFVDARCRVDGGTVILYGHNMKNGTQFSDLKKYLSTDFSNTHKNIEFQTKAGVRIYTVIDVKKTDIYDEIYNQIKPQDDTLILSTCYGSAKSDRLIVIAKEAKANA